MRRFRFVRALKFLLMAIIAVAVFGFVVMSLWNGIVPSVFGLRAITFWQAVGLLVLSRILFGRFGRPGGGHWRQRTTQV